MSDSGPKEIRTDIPFKSPLIDSGFTHSGLEDIRALKSDPEKIIRIRESKGRDISNSTNPFIYTYREVMDSLRDDYGFKVPKIDIVRYGNKGKKLERVFIITDRIHGETLANKQFKPEELPMAQAKLDDLFCLMTQYYSDVARKDTWYKHDLGQRNTQFVWGRKKGDAEDSIYMVDVGTDVQRHKKDDDLGFGMIDIFTRYGGGGVFDDLQALESKHGIQLVNARKKIVAFMDEILTSKGTMEYTKHHAKILRGRAAYCLNLDEQGQSPDSNSLR